jgi:hypothetical protein
VIVAAALSLAVGCITVFWLGRESAATTIRSSPPEAPPSETPPKPPGAPDHIAAIKTSRVDQDRAAAELLAWLERLRGDPDRMTLDDRRDAFRAIELFGELRYRPAIPFLIEEVDYPKVGVIDPRFPEMFMRESRPFDSMHPHLAALIRIGPPAAGPVVDLYVEWWKTVQNGKDGPLMNATKLALRNPALLGAALTHIQERLAKANFVPVERDDLDALHHLKWELLKRFD